MNKGPFRNYAILFLINLFLSFSFFAQSPGGISSGLTLWLKANAGTTTAGVNVTGWTDQSLAATAVTVNGSPDFVNASSGYNYNPYVNFTMSSATGGDFLRTPALNLRSFFWVAKLNNLTRTSTHLATYDGVTLSAPCSGCPIHGGTNSGVVAQYHELGYGKALFQQAGVWRKNGTATVYNTPHSGQYDIVSALGGTVVPTNVFMGGQNSNGSFDGRKRDWLGPVGEIIAYSGSITAVDANKIESYLGVKYGITLGGNGSTTLAYNSPTGTTIWNANTGYHYDVAGIGKDVVLEGLDQPKSHSINTPGDAVIMANSDFTTPTTLSADGQYLMWGHNNSALTYTCQNFIHASPSTTIATMWAREWRTQKTGTPAGDVIIAIDMSLLQGPGGLGTADNSSVRLLVDDNTVYSDGSAGEHTYSPNAGFSVTGGQLYFTVPYADIQSGQGFFKLGTINNPPTTAIAASSTTICGGTPVTFTASSVNGGTGPIYQWQLNGANVATGTTYSTSSLNNGDQVSVILTSNANCISPPTANSNTITVVVTAPFVPTVTNAASNATICPGGTVTFTATSTNGGSGPIYQWQVNGVNVASGTTYSSSVLSNGDEVSVMLTSNAACTSPLTANSNSITITVSPAVIPSVTNVASTNTLCAGSNVSFTATPTNGGTSPTYQWQVNGTNAGTGQFFSSSTLNNGDVVSVILTSDAMCVSPSTANSNSVTMIVTNTVNPSVNATANTTTICASDTVDFTATYNNGGSTPAFQWQVNGANAGTNSPNFSSSGLSNGDVVSLIMISNAACAVPTGVSSNSISINVIPTPNAAFSYLPTDPTAENATVNFQDQSLNATSWSWTFEATAGSGIQNPSYTFPGAGVYTVTLLASNGTCTSTVTQIIVINEEAEYYIPNTFTPNGDNINELFKIVGVGISNQEFEMLIYNRWGQVIFKTNDPSKGWDGKVGSGNEAPAGIYVYMISFKFNSSKDKINKVGDIHLFR